MKALTADEAKLQLVERPAVGVAAISALTGISDVTIYASIRRGDFPFPTIAVGKRIAIPSAPVRRALGLETES